MKKILLYISVLKDGGAARVLVNLANQFVAQGYEVVIATNFATEHGYVVSEGVKIIILEEKESKAGAIRKNISRCRTLRRIIKREKPQVCVSFMRENNFRFLVASFGLSTRKFVSVRSAPDKEYAGFLNRLLLKILFPLATGCIMQTQDALRWLPRRLQKKSHVIMNTIDDKFFHAKRTPPYKDIVFVGRLVASKNCELLIDAYADICDMIEDDLCIYGAGEHLSSLVAYAKMRQVEDRVHFMGRTANVDSVYETAKLFVLPSDFEGMPNALLEALTVGVPAISTDCPCGGPKEVLGIENDRGILIPIRDKEALKAAMLSVLQNEEAAQQMASSAKAYMMRFSPQRIAQEWLAYLLK